MSGAAMSEDAFEIPEPKRHLVIPRRGAASEPLTAVPDAAAHHAAWLSDHSAEVASILDNEQSAADLVAEYRATKADLATATPRTAAIAAAMALAPDTPPHNNPTDIVDAWITKRGLAFATSALMDLFAMSASGHHYKGERLEPYLSLNTDRVDYAYAADPSSRFALAARLRRHLAAAPEHAYAEAHEILAKHRASPPTYQVTADLWPRVLPSFLMPERTDWVEADFALLQPGQDMLLLSLVFSSITTEHQVSVFPTAQFHPYWIARESAVLWTAFDSLGTGLLPLLTPWLGGEMDADTTEALLDLVTYLPSDQALQFLIDNIAAKHFTAATLSAAERFPRRALRLLADVPSGYTPRASAAANVLRRHIVAHEDLVTAELADLADLADPANLKPAARAQIQRILAANVRLPEADADSLPPLFVSPPWLAAGKPAKPVTITGLTAPTETVLAWGDGEQERWASPEIERNPSWTLASWEEIADRITTEGCARWYANGHFSVSAPEELVRSVLPVWKPDPWQTEKWVRRLTIRFGADALPPVLHLARTSPATGSALLAPFASPEATLLAADWLSRLKSMRPYALAWLTRHPGVAARTLIPVALDKPGKARRAAELTLRTLAARGCAEEIAEAAAGYGEAVARAVAVLLADDGTLTLPRMMPPVPAWADARLLPQVLLRGRRTALPEQSVRHLVLMLAVSKVGEPYAGVLKAKEFCDPASLAEFAWALFENWRGSDFPAKANWAFDALRWLGDDETVRRLSPLIRVWPGENGHLRAVAGLDVLADIGGDSALMSLYSISQKVKFKALKERAVQRVADISDDLGLTAEQLADRLVPDLGLEPSGTLTLDYGPRQFTVGFDEELKPYVAVADQSDKRLKALPKPGAKDDAVLAPAAYQRFSALKKDVRALAASQIARFELAMVTQRRWTSQEFGEYFIGHPLLRHLVRRLVWATFAADGDGVGDTFRVAEDLTLADVSDNAFTLADDAVVGIVHPLHLGDAGVAWSEVFADYEILQPFAQLGRGVFELTEDEKAAGELTRFGGIDVPVGRVLGLERRGWRRGVPEDAGIQSWISRTLPGGGSVTVVLNPGITVGYVSEWGETQRFERIFLRTYDTHNGYWQQKEFPAFGGLDPVTASELLRDLTEATN